MSNEIVWTDRDFRNGWCKAEEIGRPIENEPVGGQPGIDHGAAPPVPPALMTRSERRAKLHSLVDQIINYAEAHPEAMLDDNGAQINKLLDIFQKMEESDDTGAGIRVESERAFARLTPLETDRAILTVLMEYVPADRRNEALERIGMPLEEFERRRVCLDDLDALRTRQAALQDRIAEIIAETHRDGRERI